MLYYLILYYVIKDDEKIKGASFRYGYNEDEALQEFVTDLLLSGYTSYEIISIERTERIIG